MNKTPKLFSCSAAEEQCKVEDLTGEEDGRRLISFKQSCRPVVKTQPETHS